MRVKLTNMACCWSSRDTSDKESNFILDVEQILKDCVWKEFKDSRSSLQKLCLRRRDYVVEVPMNYFHFDKIKDVVDPRPIAIPPEFAPKPSTLTQSMTHVGQEVKDNPLLSCNHVMALSTDFTNSTTKDQTYSFRFEKTRKASLNVTFQKGFTVGGKVNFSLGLPKKAVEGKVGGEVDMRINVSKSTGEVIEETLTWTASSEITVKEKASCTAKVLLSEAPVSYNFRLWTKMSMPSGGAPATVRHRKAKAGDWRWTMIIENLKQVFQDYIKVVDFHSEPLGEDSVTHSVIIKTAGIVEGVRLSGQKIVLEEHPLRHGPSSSSSSFSFSNSNNNNSGGSRGMVTAEGSYQDGYVGSSGGASPHPAGRMLALESSPPPPPPIIKEVVEEEEKEEGGPPSAALPPTPSSVSPPVSALCGGGGGGGHPVPPRITTTSASSLASSPLSDTGSPDMSDSSRKSQTVTTV